MIRVRLILTIKQAELVVDGCENRKVMLTLDQNDSNTVAKFPEFILSMLGYNDSQSKLVQFRIDDFDVLLSEHRAMDLLRDNDLVTMSIMLSEALVKHDQQCQQKDNEKNCIGDFQHPIIETPVNTVAENSSFIVEETATKRTRRKRGGSTTKTIHQKETEQQGDSAVLGPALAPASLIDVQSLWEYFRDQQATRLSSSVIQPRQSQRKEQSFAHNKRQRVSAVSRCDQYENVAVASISEHEEDDLTQTQQSTWRQITAHDQLQAGDWICYTVSFDLENSSIPKPSVPLQQGLVQDISWDEVSRCYQVLILTYDIQRGIYNDSPTAHPWNNLAQVYIANNFGSGQNNEIKEMKVVDEDLQHALFMKKKALLLASFI